GLAMACFVKAFGITFLALPRSDAAAHAHEASLPIRVGMLTLAGACVVLGVGPTLVVPAFGAVASAVLGTAPEAISGDWLTVHVSGRFASVSTAAIAIVLAGSFLAPLVALRLVGASHRTRAYETWGCGRIVQTARMEYTATAFANPFKRVFDFFYRPTKRL